MRKRIAVVVLSVTALCYGSGRAQGQDENATSGRATPEKAATSESKPQADRHETPIKPYRLDFYFIELENGKRINTRHYSMNLAGGSVDEIKIGARVPVHTGPPQTGTGGNALVDTQFSYMDVGTNIWASLRERGDDLQLEVKSDISSLDMNSRHDGDSRWLPPIVRQIKISGVTLLVTGKPIIIGSMDDPNSNREFQLEVTPTNLR
jgi:hypothetical protein